MGGKYRNTGLVIQFMFIYIASVAIKIVPRHSKENRGQASNIVGIRCYNKMWRPFKSVDHSHKLVTVQLLGLFGDF